jgi:hypothetical protein
LWQSSRGDAQCSNTQPISAMEQNFTSWRHSAVSWTRTKKHRRSLSAPTTKQASVSILFNGRPQATACPLYKFIDRQVVDHRMIRLLMPRLMQQKYSSHAVACGLPLNQDDGSSCRSTLEFPVRLRHQGVPHRCHYAPRDDFLTRSMRTTIIS